jgi:hypothetical protein
MIIGRSATVNPTHGRTRPTESPCPVSGIAAGDNFVYACADALGPRAAPPGSLWKSNEQQCTELPA